MKRPLLSLLSAGSLFIVLAMVAFAAPTLTVVNTQVAILSDGKLDIQYRLSFAENDPRNKITTIGPFDPSHQIVDAKLEYPGGSSPVNLVSQEGDKYTANFAITTEPGKTYTVTVHYKVNRALDTTRIGADDFRVIDWAPIQWALPIGQEIVTFITPIELPANITQPEQVTQDIVDSAGWVEDSANKVAFDRWVYYPTPDTATGKNYLSLYVSKKNLPAQAELRAKFYIPARYFAQIPAATANATVPAPGATSVAPAPASRSANQGYALAALGLMFLGLGGLIALVIGAVMFFAARPRTKPVTYQPPEIELETFEKPGRVPDLDAVQAALYVANNAKVISLVVLALVQRGVLNIANRKPLQLEVIDAAQKMLDSVHHRLS